MKPKNATANKTTEHLSPIAFKCESQLFWIHSRKTQARGSFSSIKSPDSSWSARLSLGQAQGLDTRKSMHPRYVVLNFQQISRSQHKRTESQGHGVCRPRLTEKAFLYGLDSNPSDSHFLSTVRRPRTSTVAASYMPPFLLSLVAFFRAIHRTRWVIAVRCHRLPSNSSMVYAS